MGIFKMHGMTSKETKELNKLRLAYEKDLERSYEKRFGTEEFEKRYGKKQNQPTEPNPAPKPKAQPVSPPEPTPKPEATPAPKPKAKPKAKPEPPPEPVKQVGVEIINNNSKSFWQGQGISILKLQCELRGKRFTDAETKGTSKYVKGIFTKVKPMRKKDYLDVLLKMLKIT